MVVLGQFGIRTTWHCTILQLSYLLPHQKFWFKILQDSCHNICLVILGTKLPTLSFCKKLFVFWSWCQLAQPSQQQGKVCTLCNFDFSYSLSYYKSQNVILNLHITSLFDLFGDIWRLSLKCGKTCEIFDSLEWRFAIEFGACQSILCQKIFCAKSEDWAIQKVVQREWQLPRCNDGKSHSIYFLKDIQQQWLIRHYHRYHDDYHNKH